MIDYDRCIIKSLKRSSFLFILFIYLFFYFPLVKVISRFYLFDFAYIVDTKFMIATFLFVLLLCYFLLMKFRAEVVIFKFSEEVRILSLIGASEKCILKKTRKLLWKNLLLFFPMFLLVPFVVSFYFEFYLSQKESLIISFVMLFLFALFSNLIIFNILKKYKCLQKKI